uniref:Sugar phosphate transporter domain-containing protein n=1 Tax=Pinguiococcus pyrenoidosus TaxID=172671 RepID=A0A7R9UFN0_9STRA|mmetsp:Transcript_6494/g.25140  ORF Transcript_6494/g.25140 Transcript_6494/m.25140 type:complete len:332 (+) Transcript_6494:121-1116(+)
MQGWLGRRQEAPLPLVDGGAAPPKRGVPSHSRTEKVFAAALYAATSLVLVSANKVVLTSYAFPSSNALATSQFLTTAVAVKLASCLGYVKVAPFGAQVLRQVLPITVLFLVDVLCGLAGTKFISLPMFAVLRRFSIPTTMFLERMIQQSRPSSVIQLSVWVMVLGAIVAAVNDLAFSLLGYSFIFVNDLATASRGVYIKSLTHGQRASKIDLLYYNAVLSLLWMTAFVPLTEDVGGIAAFEGWQNPRFLVMFACSSALGVVLQYSIYLCTSANSALTTTVVGCLKNAAVTYLGMVIGGDYAYSLWNFVGVNLSMGASIVYVYAAFRSREKK